MDAGNICWVYLKVENDQNPRGLEGLLDLLETLVASKELQSSILSDIFSFFSFLFLLSTITVSFLSLVPQGSSRKQHVGRVQLTQQPSQYAQCGSWPGMKRQPETRLASLCFSSFPTMSIHSYTPSVEILYANITWDLQTLPPSKLYSQ